MDFNQRVVLGRTGLEVSRLGLATGYGAPAACLEKAFHEYGLNYFFVSFIKRRQARLALANLLPGHRDELVLTLPYTSLTRGTTMRTRVEGWLRRLKTDAVDFILLLDVRKPRQKLFDEAMKLKEEGKVRFIGMSSHDRPLLGRLVRGELNLPVDLIHLRYNLVHRGAEEDIFPHLDPDNRPGVVGFTATCWRKPLKARNMPPGEKPLTAPDCYRFVLGNPNIDVCVTGPSKTAQMEENLTALAAGPLSGPELARAIKIGDHIHGR